MKVAKRTKISILWFLFLCSSLAIILTGCGGGGSTTPTTTSTTQSITIKGNFTGGTNASLLERFFAWLSPSTATALDPNQVTQVIMFTGESSYTVAPVINGGFSVDVSRGQPWGMVFAGPNNNYLGHLTLLNGIDSLPLINIDNSVATIDLQTLSSLENTVDALHNPIGNEITLSVDEQFALSQADDFLASVVKNPDVDGNGILDVLEGKFFRPFVMYSIDGGTFGSSLTPTVNSTAAIKGWRFNISSGLAASYPQSVTFTGPAGTGLSNTPSDTPIINPSYAVYGSPYIDTIATPPAGTYKVGYDTSTLSFDIPDQSQAPSRVIMAVPTVSLNNDGTINKISWIYKLPGGTLNLTPKSVIKDLIVQIDGVSGTTPCGNYPSAQGNRIYNSDNLPASTTEVTFTCQIKWSDVTTIYMAYNDVYGNHDVVTYLK